MKAKEKSSDYAKSSMNLNEAGIISDTPRLCYGLSGIIMKYFLILSLVIIPLSLGACKKEKNSNSVICEQKVIISQSEYESAPQDYVKINSLEIIDNCVIINYSSSGCSGDTWEIKLIDAGIVLESFPPKRNLVFSLENNEPCEAYITKETAFDISNLKVNGSPVRLNITNTGDSILYEY